MSVVPMSSDDPIGKLFRMEGGPTILQWQISNFSTLSDETDVQYFSPGFFFMGKRWYLQIFPNEDDDYDGMGLHLGLEAGKCPYKIAGAMCLTDVTGKEHYRDTFKHRFDEADDTYGIEICTRSEVMSRRSEFLPADVLTVRCTLKVERSPDPVSLIRRLKTVSRNMKATLKLEKNSDVIFNLRGRSFKAHRAILGTGSKVFAAMFTHDMVENRTGEISIDDVEADVFEKVLTYMYSGQVDDLCADSVFDLYKAADKYDLQELKVLCKYFMEENMSVELFCDVVALADTYDEKHLTKLVKHFFNNHRSSIVESETWGRFVKKHSLIAAELLTCIVKENVDRDIAPSAKRLRCS